MPCLQHANSSPPATPPSPPPRPSFAVSWLPSPPASSGGSPQAHPRAFQKPGVASIGREIQPELAKKQLQTETEGKRESVKHLETLGQLQYYLTTNCLLDILQSTPQGLWFHPITDSNFGPLRQAFSGQRQYKPIRINYDPSSATLRLWMTSPLHDSVQIWASRMLRHINDSLPVTDKLDGVALSWRLPTTLYSTSDGPNAEYLPPNTASKKRKQLPAQLPTKRSKKKAAAITKTPDFAYLCPGICPGETYPHVVFESGWSETPVELAADAEQWLVKTDGHTRVVVTLYFEEQKSENPVPLRKKELRETYARLQAEAEESEGEADEDNSGVEQEEEDAEEVDSGEVDSEDKKINSGVGGSNKHGPDPPSSPLSTAPSTASDHLRDRATLNTDLWVGPITVHINVWRYYKPTGRPYRDGPVYVLHPDGSISPPNNPPPRIYLSDLCNDKAGKTGSGRGGDGKAWEFNWAELRELVNAGRKRYAFVRKSDVEKQIAAEFGLD